MLDETSGLMCEEVQNVYIVKYLLTKYLLIIEEKDGHFTIEKASSHHFKQSQNQEKWTCAF